MTGYSAKVSRAYPPQARKATRRQSARLICLVLKEKYASQNYRRKSRVRSI
ncbi:hypothetical protein HNQ04_003965 [Deinococcus radiopugnans ATCC 19172]|uniref:Transposase n=1 Tax=Deinococcus radiopugnans ATCC 19172 TaxID=585398 RepID=A0ABR6NYY6_9DEIO|nr:hypothetical protein [Deinococcus radiopugnans ATCC 19172]